MKSIRPSTAYISESRAKTLLDKWKPVLEYKSENVRPIEDDHTRLNTAILLENQEQWCMEASNTNSGGVLAPVVDKALTVTSSLLRMILLMHPVTIVYLRSSFR